MRAPITEIAHRLSMEKFYSTVAKMQKKRMTTPKLWASFRPQNRQEVQIPAKFAVKSWEDQIFGARRRCHRKTDRDHAIPVKQGFQPCFFLPFGSLSPSSSNSARSVHASKPHSATLSIGALTPGENEWSEGHKTHVWNRPFGALLATGNGPREWKAFPMHAEKAGMFCLKAVYRS